jgi:hypothetical protein
MKTETSMATFRPLVPKLCLGTHLSLQLRCLPAAKQSFEDIRIPKQSLGTRDL